MIDFQDRRKNNDLDHASTKRIAIAKMVSEHDLMRDLENDHETAILVRLLKGAK